MRLTLTPHTGRGNILDALEHDETITDADLRAMADSPALTAEPELLARIAARLPAGPDSARIMARAIRLSSEAREPPLPVADILKHARVLAPYWEVSDLGAMGWRYVRITPHILRCCVLRDTPDAQSAARAAVAAEIREHPSWEAEDKWEALKVAPWATGDLALDDMYRILPDIKLGESLMEQWERNEILASLTLKDESGRPTRYPSEAIVDRASLLLGTAHVQQQLQLLLTHAESVSRLLGPNALGALAERVISAYNPRLDLSDDFRNGLHAKALLLALADTNGPMYQLGADWVTSQSLRLTRYMSMRVWDGVHDKDDSWIGEEMSRIHEIMDAAIEIAAAGNRTEDTDPMSRPAYSPSLSVAEGCVPDAPRYLPFPVHLETMERFTSHSNGDVRTFAILHAGTVDIYDTPRLQALEERLRCQRSGFAEIVLPPGRPIGASPGVR